MVSTVTTSSSAGSDQVPVPAPAVVEERKRRRKESNRLSAQRSRARKQQQLDDLAAQVAELRARNGAMALAASEAARRCAAVQAQNDLLRARCLELSARLESLTELAQYYCLDDAAATTTFPAACGFVTPQPPLLDVATMHCNYYQSSS
ncbi:hypothetical protein GUJ93_ZPchr0008g13107 [Zizania palustris]|uniref:BZIP domain-containing protein n=1 Tax=Zizania palustris TaxID=103762 RepID=A0A8J5R3J0_ZIZPA|nr:hypothetical protein GUJ93_ZPchr0008g13107 [Zizania palustris]